MAAQIVIHYETILVTVGVKIANTLTYFNNNWDNPGSRLVNTVPSPLRTSSLECQILPNRRLSKQLTTDDTPTAATNCTAQSSYLTEVCAYDSIHM